MPFSKNLENLTANPIKIKSDKPLRASFLEIRDYEIKERENHAVF